jgi:hypothetical protein
VLIGLNGSKSMLSLRCFPSSVMTSLILEMTPKKEGDYPQKTTSPFGGTRLYNLSLC